jgi:putative addiction module component (TIGR02574 family)
MSDKAERLKTELSGLPLSEQLAIADFIYDSVPVPPDPPFEEGSPEFEAMLDRRLADYTSGRTKGIPAEEVMERLRKKYAR